MGSFAFATLERSLTSISPMPQFRVLFALLWAMVCTVPAAFAQNATPAPGAKAEKSTVIVRDVKFAQTKLGGQMNPWNRMQVELMAGDNPDPKALNKKWVDKVKVTVTAIFKPTSAKDATEFSYYRSSATVLTMEVNSDRSVYFYLPGDIVKRDRLKMQPDYYYVQLEVGGTEVPLFSEAGRINPDQLAAVHKQFVNKKDFDGARDLADRGAGANAGMLRPQYLVPYAIFDNLPQGSPSPEFIREDSASR